MEESFSIIQKQCFKELEKQSKIISGHAVYTDLDIQLRELQNSLLELTSEYNAMSESYNKLQFANVELANQINLDSVKIQTLSSQLSIRDDSSESLQSDIYIKNAKNHSIRI